MKINGECICLFKILARYIAPIFLHLFVSNL